jgi:hypothetical protein
MSSVRFGGDGVKPACPTCHGTGTLPDPLSAQRGDTMPCPACRPPDALADALRDVHDALQRALTETEGPALPAARESRPARDPDAME